ncbi:MAG: Rrf2 family transcriptional regulator [Gloeomargarita sp. SKYG116]|nr:Rrf2 family transcriptional regulator [Gloeomargarita sp. SKYG116]MCS7293014.1 Rrf2 family transcriptional regulator [Gloeomargarita sp. SKYB120]MDW8178579.1 Rrf2 family transcriptional regulator [Gloeomargarita sp. SKYBB_i_bin120]MDW8400205.1 Rrf2 family transcriptional regulator [Gloeomargarita sp. SKYGB_i_bin116]
MELSCKTEYALLALMALADGYGRDEPVQISQIAQEQGIPDRYLEQLLATLRRGNLVRSQRGAKGGYFLARSPWQINLLDVWACLEGTTPVTQPAATTPERAVIHHIWQEVQQATHAIWQKYTLKDLCQKRDSLRQRDLMYYI